MPSLYLDWFYMCALRVCIALARPHGDRVEALAREASSCGMGAIALPLPARVGRQHTVKGSHKKNGLNAVASKCIKKFFV